MGQASSDRLASGVARDVLTALHALHSAGFVHGAVCPQHVVRCSDSFSANDDAGSSRRLGQQERVGQQHRLVGLGCVTPIGDAPSLTSPFAQYDAQRGGPDAHFVAPEMWKGESGLRRHWRRFACFDIRISRELGVSLKRLERDASLEISRT